MQVEGSATQRIIKQLRDCCLADWQWDDARRIVKLRFSWISFLGGEGRDVLLYLYGVSRFSFEYPDDKNLNEYYSVFDASLKRGLDEEGNSVFYRLRLEGEVTMNVTCQACEVFEQVTFTDTDVETAVGVKTAEESLP